MPPRTLTSRSVFRRQPPHVPKSPHLGASLEQHQHPLVDGIDQHDLLTLFVLCDSLPRPCCRPLLAALVNDGSKRRIDVVALAPIAYQAVKSFWQGERARIEVERKLRLEIPQQLRRRDPVVFAVIPVAEMKLILARL